MTARPGLRFLTAGVAAGVAVNIFDGVLYTLLLGAEAAAVLEGLGLAPPGPAGMALYAAIGFLIGFVAIWLYTGMRARLGDRPATAIKTGLAVWAIAYLAPFLDLTIEGLFTARMFWLAATYTFLSTPLVVVLGAWVYRRMGARPGAAEVRPGAD